MEELPVQSQKKKSNILLIVVIALAVAACLGCLTFLVVTGLGLSLLDFSAIR
jgi:flagellar basal body-associated protein FliL